MAQWKIGFENRLKELLQGLKPRIENIPLMKIFYGLGFKDGQKSMEHK